MMGRRTFLVGLAAASLPAAAHTEMTLATDTHAHVFTRSLPLATRRRYSVDYDATPDRYLAMLSGNGMHRGVLIQPSFLGFDNNYLLAALARAPDRMRGIAALENVTPLAEMNRLAAGGIAGIRLNLLGRGDPDFRTRAWQDHLSAVRALGWQVEVQCEAARLPRLLPALLDADLPIVIDHFGRPDAASAVSDPGFLYLLRQASRGRVHVKMSGAYRVGEALADRLAPMLRDAFGPSRLLWGSDWPHTQFESVADPRVARAALDRWIPDPAERNLILQHNPARLFKFASAQASVLMHEQVIP
jgi:predicted TIM-barrel fold metal-dependent hydrolase